MATWYVRPSTAHGGTRNGTTYATAWGGWSEIVWGAGGFTAGDTLNVCGPHAYAASVTVGAHLGSLGLPATIRGDAPEEAGSITFAGSSFVSQVRSFTDFRNISITGATSNCVFISGNLSGIGFYGVRFVGGTSAIVSFNSTSAYAGVTFNGCRFSAAASTASGGIAINWLVVTGQTSTMSDFTLEDNIFEDCVSISASRGVVHLRIQSDANVLSRMERVSVLRNQWRRCRGVACEINTGFATYGASAGLRVIGNTVEDITETTNALGGAFALWGFTTDPAFENDITRNTVNRVAGPTGGFNLFYGTYDCYDNVVDGTTTTTIDGNGVLFDFGTQNSRAWGNKFRNLAGKIGTSNSGVGIMVLDSTGVKAWGNLIDNCYVGVHLGPAGPGQSCDLFNNTFLRVRLYGIDVVSTADEANCQVRNSLFTAENGSVVSVRNSGAAWTGENYNAFRSFAAASGHTLGANDRTDDPRTTSDGVPMVGSPLLTAGADLGYVRDIDGRQGKKYMGAYTAAALRDV